MMDWMLEKDLKFFVIHDRTLYCAIHAERIALYYEEDKWQSVDYITQIADRIMGFDPHEAPGFKLNNRWIQDEIKEITKEQAIERFGKSPIKLVKKAIKKVKKSR